LKCAYHPDTEATETCANCSMPICSACGIPIDSKTYCDACISEIFARHAAKPGGILGVIAGIIAFFFGGLLTANAVSRGDRLEWAWGAHAGPSIDWTQASYGIALMALGLLAIIGSRCALVREHYKLAVVGGVCATLCVPLLGIPALILIVCSRDEFNQPYADSCQKESPDLLSRLHW
jgi:hypothetical protein